MRLNTPTEPPPQVWEESLLDSKLEAQLTQSIEIVKRGSPPPRLGPASFDKATQNESGESPLGSPQIQPTTHAQLIAGCGIAAIDGYLAARDYATAKGLQLIEMKQNGIDLQDLISTLVIDFQKRAELESRQPGAARYKR